MAIPAQNRRRRGERLGAELGTQDAKVAARAIRVIRAQRDETAPRGSSEASNDQEKAQRDDRRKNTTKDGNKDRRQGLPHKKPVWPMPFKAPAKY